MSKIAANLELKLEELDLMSELLQERIEEWERALREVGRGEASLNELIDCDSEVDAEYQLEVYRQLENRLGTLQQVNRRNTVEFIDETSLYRPEQSVELLRVRDKYGVDSIVDALESRHGVYFLYTDLESLVDSFVQGKDSVLRFECRKELELFLNYWKV
ncbi:hypothetical protein ACFPK9_04005 [Rubritalea spongiae]|uniref:Uncharacterized protein n=1 Tax=Rubritalea spongiae TaxID=430797 RepID=A0ABW5E497_9BACT